MRVTGFIFFVIGLGLLVGASIPTKSSLDLRSVGIEVPGTVVQYTTSTDEDGSSYSPIYRYEVAGVPYTHEATVSTSSVPTIGSVEPLLVHPDDPTLVKPNSFMGMWFLTALLGGMGALFLIIGIVALGAAWVGSGVSRRLERGAGGLGIPGHDLSSRAHEDDHEREAKVTRDRDARRRTEQQSSHDGPFL